MSEPILVIMAAGMGSRYGGLKQIDPVGSHGELIIDYSIYDALRAGFKKVVFIIKKADELAFKESIGNRIAEVVDVEYAFQELDKLPNGYKVPEDRVKPWGTAHAILCAKELINEPFAVINADDYYGPSAFKAIYTFLKSNPADEAYHYAMVGYTLSNTLTENGHVARGVCSVKDNKLCSITERTHIAKHEGITQFLEEDTWTPISDDSIVSMNLWGFMPSFLDEIEKGFTTFLDQALATNPLKGEYFLPSVVDSLIHEGKAEATVLHSTDRWYGVTYKEDKPVVVEAIKNFQEQGLYPKNIWTLPYLTLANHFKFEGDILTVNPTGNGHINDTLLVTTDAGKKYILQRLNQSIFKEPKNIMENIENVLSHLKAKLEGMSNVDLERELLTLVYTDSGECYYIDKTGDFWRSYLYIDHTISYDIVPNTEVYRSCAKKFGEFQKLLSDFDASILHEAIPNFHNTPVRFETFLKTLEADPVGRAASVKEEIDFLLARKEDMHALTDKLEAGILPLRVTHNDTKINNVLVDANSKEALCVIDLDTIMPGLAAYDFGDCIRSGATSGAEDEPDLTKVNFVTELFESFAEGFIGAVGQNFDEEEIMSLLMGAKLMTLECGMRFLTDHLDGDNYFKIHRENHNLDRARTQFKLVQDMENQWDELTAIIKKFIVK